MSYCFSLDKVQLLKMAFRPLRSATACLIQSLAFHKLLCSLPSSLVFTLLLPRIRALYSRPSACNTILFSLCLNNSACSLDHICITASQENPPTLCLVQGLPVASFLLCVSLCSCEYLIFSPPLLPLKHAFLQDRHWVSFG